MEFVGLLPTMGLLLHDTVQQTFLTGIQHKFLFGKLKQNFSLAFENLMEKFKDGMIILQTTFVGWKIQVEGIEIRNKGIRKWK